MYLGLNLRRQPPLLDDSFSPVGHFELTSISALECAVLLVPRRTYLIIHS